MISLATLALFAAANQSGDEMRLIRYPDVHGDTVVFTYAADLWECDLKGGLARRLTSHPATEQYAKISPDGKQIAFVASYDGKPDVYVMPIEGGEPKRLTYEPAGDIVVGWTKDGKIAYSTTAYSNDGGLPRLMIIRPNGGLPETTPVLEAYASSFSPDGDKVAYNRVNSYGFNWRRYRGGTQGKVSIYDLKNNKYSELPTGRENNWYPMWIGNTIYFASDKADGTVNLYKYDLGSRKETQITKYTDGDIKYPSTDGKTIVFERDGYLNAMDVASEEITKINPRVVSENLASRPALKKLGSQISEISLSPSGVRVGAVARGELFTIPVKNGETRNLSSSSGSREKSVGWSPDGQSIAYLSDKSGEYQIYVQPQMGGAETQITTYSGASIDHVRWSPDSKMLSFDTTDNKLMFVDVATRKVTEIDKGEFGGLGDYDWSPDSKWIAYSKSGPNLNNAIYLYELASGKSSKVTEGYYSDSSVSFDKNGKYLYFISGRTIDPENGTGELNVTNSAIKQKIYFLILSKGERNPLLKASDEEPVKPTEGAQPQEQPKKDESTKVDLDGLANRTISIPVVPGVYLTVKGGNNGVFFLTPDGLFKYDIGDDNPDLVLPGQVQAFDFNPTCTKIAYYVPGMLGVVDVRPGLHLGDGRVSLNNVEAVISPREEWKQMFWESWRYERDNYYDKNMLGLDWNAIGKHYASFLPDVNNRNDLNYVLGLLIGELGTSHSYVGGGDLGPMPSYVPTGMLGADYELSDNHIRFQRIYPGLNFEPERRGPLGAPGVDVKEGDYLLAIDGEPVVGNANPNQFLVGKVGHTVTLTVNDKPTLEGARKVEVRPIGDEYQLRYIEWVEGNRRKVSEMSGGKIGYLHVPNTGDEGAIEFVKGLYSQSDKQAMIIDERNNGGGNIPTFFVDRLQLKQDTFIRTRNSGEIGFPIQTMNGPKVMLINQWAGSGGDHFPWLFKTRHVGTVIGTRTWGGLVGISDPLQLVDGGAITSPTAGLYDPVKGEWIAENKGIDPDIEVDLRPDLYAQGRDPQLEKAVEVLLDQLKKNPWQKKTPDFPKVKTGGGGGHS